MQYMSAKNVKAEFGGICDMTLHRGLADKTLAFPKPVYIKRRRYFDAGEIESFKLSVASRPLPTDAAN